MAFVLNNVPGFSDLPDTPLAAERLALGILLARVYSNAAFGTCRLEFFLGQYVNGDTVPVPTSPIDGYVYGRDELSYLWTPYLTTSKETGWTSFAGSFWWMAWLVDQSTGDVASAEFYRNSHSGLDGNSGETTDGQLLVLTVAQRRRDSLLMATLDQDGVPFGAQDWVSYADAAFPVDKALNTTLCKDLNHDGKLAVVGTEVVYMGEYYNGQQVLNPISPIDGYVYAYPEVVFQHCWRWTTLGNSDHVVFPPNSDRQLQDINAAVDSTGNVAISVQYKDDTDTGRNTETTHGRIAVFAFCRRSNLIRNPWLNQTDGTTQPPAGWQLTGPFSGSGTLRADQLSFSTPPAAANPPVGTRALKVTYDVADDANNAVFSSGLFELLNGESYRFSTWLRRTTSGSGTVSVETTSLLLQNPVSDTNWHYVEATFTFSSDFHNKEVKASDNGNGSVFEFYAPCLTKTADTNAAGDGNSFAELDIALFYPGTSLRASTMKQLMKDAKQAYRTPEFFGPTLYAHGSTVPRPTSPIDGYQYARAECVYLWTWGNTSHDNTSGDAVDIRVVWLKGWVDQDTGAVTIVVGRLPGGGAPTPHNEGQLSVTVIGQRSAEASEIFASPDDPDTPTGTDNADLSEFLINGT